MIKNLKGLIDTSNQNQYEDSGTIKEPIKTGVKGELKTENNETIQYEEMTITAHNCKQTDPFDAENFFVFLEIYTKTDGRVFSGWMNHNEPGQNPLQNDAWDVWLEKCE